MKYCHVLSAIGADQPGIVAFVTKILFEHGCNLEDSAMMRLGAEFGIFLIFSSPKMSEMNTQEIIFSVEKKFGLSVNIKKITRDQAHHKTVKKNIGLVTVHGVDRPGIVHYVTSLLSAHKFNITDLNTHRTFNGNKPGYILFIEGELPSVVAGRRITEKLKILSQKLHVRISMKALLSASI